MSEHTGKFIISDKVKKEIDHWVKKYPSGKQQSAVVAALLLVQEQNSGWLSEAAMNSVAIYLDLAPIIVYEAASFYDMYNLQPIGKHKISVCTNVPCMLRGSEKIVDCLQKRLGIKFGETTTDGLFTLRETECMAACVGGPMCQIDDRHYHENLTEEKILDLIKQLENQEKNAHG